MTDAQFFREMAAAHRHSVTRLNKAAAKAWDDLAARTAATPPPPAPTPTPTPAPTTTPGTAGPIPLLPTVGPQGWITTNTATRLNGHYEYQQFGAVTSIAPGSVLGHCELAWYSLACQPNVRFDHCRMFGGAWHEEGSHDGWVIDHCVIDGGAMQALRPKGAGKITVRDTWMMSHGTPPAGAHTETVQHMHGAQGVYERCAFSRKPVSNNTVTAIVTMEAPGDGVGVEFIDCTFGYWNGTGWERGGGVYGIYPAQASFARPTIHHPNPWYTTPRLLT